MIDEPVRVVLDTNVLVAAGFNRASAAAAIVRAVRRGRLALVWNRATLEETRGTVRRIGPLDWAEFGGLYRPEHGFEGRTRVDRFGAVDDPADRKFAALAEAAGAVLVSNDQHLLGVRGQLGIEVLTPREFLRARWAGG